VSSRLRLCHVFPNFGHGGPEVRTSGLINALGTDFEHVIIALNGNFSGRSRLRADAPVRFVTPSARTPCGLGPLLRKQHADLLLTYGWGGTDALLGARLAGISRVVHGEDGFLPDEAFRERPKRRLARRVLLRLAETIVVPSRTLCTVARDSWRIPPHHIAYIPNGVDLVRFSVRPPAERARARSALGIATAETVIGTAGILRVEKNYRRLVRAFADAKIRKDTRLLILGEGPERNELVRLSAELGVAERVLMPGLVEDLSPYYAAMDVFAISSDTEQMPIVLLEAMASALPVVSTDVGDVSIMISAANKPFLVPIGDDRGFVDALAALVDGPMRMEVGAQNRAKCEREFGLDAMIRAYRNLYRTFATGARDHVPAIPTNAETR